MNPTSTPTWYELALVLGAIVGAGGIVAAVTAWLWRQLGDQRRDLADFKVDVARQYVTSEALLQVETRLLDAINRMADRFDRVMDALLRRAGDDRAG
jgi:hypothetical protein